MIAEAGGTYFGLLSFLSFAFSVMAAVLAIDMYALLRTGEFGSTWRVLIIASVIFALVQALRMAEFFNPKVADYGLSQIAELMFVMALAYAFYLQRRAFARAAALRESAERRGEPRIEAPLRFNRKMRRSTAQNDDIRTIAPNHLTPNDADDKAALSAVSDENATDTDDDMDEDPDIEWSHSPQRDSHQSPLPRPPAQTSG